MRSYVLTAPTIEEVFARFEDADDSDARDVCSPGSGSAAAPAGDATDDIGIEMLINPRAVRGGRGGGGGDAGGGADVGAASGVAKPRGARGESTTLRELPNVVDAVRHDSATHTSIDAPRAPMLPPLSTMLLQLRLIFWSKRKSSVRDRKGLMLQTLAPVLSVVFGAFVCASVATVTLPPLHSRCPPRCVSYDRRLPVAPLPVDDDGGSRAPPGLQPRGAVQHLGAPGTVADSVCQRRHVQGGGRQLRVAAAVGAAAAARAGDPHRRRQRVVATRV
jgi:hypothetical protein